MCGRYTLTVPRDELIETFDVPPLDFDYFPRFNIAPTQAAPVIARDRRGTRMGALRWGLVPSWSEGGGPPLINARAETLLRKPSFKDALFRRRCLVPADGFYEWEKTPEGKVPHWFHRPGAEPMTFAGLWERAAVGDDPIYTFTIVTVEPADAVRPIHDRMPAILPAEEREAWLDSANGPAEVLPLLRPFEGPILSRRVSTLVNSFRNDEPACIEPVEDGSESP